MAALRGMKAEGGWGVVSTQFCEIHPTSDLEALPYDRMWDDNDVTVMANMVDLVHQHGSLAALQLAHAGLGARNFYSRMPALGPGSLRNIFPTIPAQSRAMDLSDIKEFRGWHKDAVKRGLKAGFDVIYVSASHNMSLPAHFLSRRYNKRSDEYGGSLENRVRLMREVIEDTKELIGHRCAVAVRFPVEEMMGDAGLTYDGEGRDVIEMLAELPDLWDVNLAPWMNDSMSSRFSEEGFQEKYVSFVKSVTTKPVVGVGRFTSPDTMVSQIKRGVLDLIGAARPSIADPFLPNKIRDRRFEDIRECIGCNVCVSADLYGTPIRCTQNPTIGEEWRRGWHPERVAPKRKEASILVIGAGPAGLECAVSLGKRGYDVALAEASRELGGRVVVESRLAACRPWIRVRDYRVSALSKLPNVSIYPESLLSVDDVFGLGFQHVVVATGAKWRRDGVGGSVFAPVPLSGKAIVLTPDDVLDGVEVKGPALIYDDDHYYMGSALAEHLRAGGIDVTLVTSHSEVSAWTTYTLEQRRIQGSLLKAGIQVQTGYVLKSISEDEAEFACIYTGARQRREFGSIILLTAKDPVDWLYRELKAREQEARDAGVLSVAAIGDCMAPAAIASAVFAGHEYAMTFQEPFRDESFVRERIVLATAPRTVMRAVVQGGI
jgi:dimethylamine/trimethylamine dehydrogenase